VTRLFGTALVTLVVAGLVGPVRAEDKKDAGPIIDKAIKALGGMEKLGPARSMTWKGHGVITFGGDDNKFSSEVTTQLPGKFRSGFEGEFMGNKVTGATVLNGDKGWRKFNDDVTEFDKDGMANEHRNIHLQVIPTLVFPLKLKIFKVEVAGEEKVDGKEASVLKVTGPEGKDFKLFFDKESGLPVKSVANVVGFGGDEAVQESTYGDYKDFDGIKKATKVVTKRGGEKFMTLDITEFKVLKEVDPKTFAEPK
jgi:hypothetical protein